MARVPYTPFGDPLNHTDWMATHWPKGYWPPTPHTGQRARPPADFGPYWPLRDGVEAYARPHRRGGGGLFTPRLLQTAKFTPNFGFTLKKKSGGDLSSISPAANCKLTHLCSRLKRLHGRSVTEEDRGANFS